MTVRAGIERGRAMQIARREAVRSTDYRTVVAGRIRHMPWFYSQEFSFLPHDLALFLIRRQLRLGTSREQIFGIARRTHGFWPTSPLLHRGAQGKLRFMSSRPALDYSELTIPERLQLVEDIWDSIAADVDAEVLPLTEAERILLDERLDERDAQPDAALPWSAVRARILGKHRR